MKNALSADKKHWLSPVTETFKVFDGASFTDQCVLNILRLHIFLKRNMALYFRVMLGEYSQYFRVMLGEYSQNI